MDFIDGNDEMVLARALMTPEQRVVTSATALVIGVEANWRRFIEILKPEFGDVLALMGQLVEDLADLIDMAQGGDDE